MFQIRSAQPDDSQSVLALYRETAAIPGGLARLEHEITDTYISNIFKKATIQLVVEWLEEESPKIVGEIHASIPEPVSFSHVLSDLTLAIHPDFQGKGIGKAMFAGFIHLAETEFPQIKRIELIARSSNLKALDLYRKLGFREEGRLKNRIQNLDSTYEDDVMMALLIDREED